MNLLAAALYDPGTAAQKSTANALAMTALDTTNLRLTVTVPAHGMLRFRLTCTVEGATTFPQIMLGILKSATVIGRVTPIFTINGTALATTHATAVAEFTATGLAVASTTYDAAYAVETGVASTNINYGGPDDTTPDNAWGAFVFEIWDPRPIPTAAPGAANGLTICGSNAAITFASWTCTGTQTISDGIVVTRSSSNTSAVTFTGNGTGNGFVVKSGSGATGDGMQVTSLSTNGKGFNITGTGSGDGMLCTGGSGAGGGATFNGGAGTGSGLNLVGGATAGDGLTCSGTVGHGANFVAAGFGKHGILATGVGAASGNAAGDGLHLVGGAGATGVGNVAGVGFNAIGGAGAASANGAGAGISATGGGTVTVSGNAGMVITGTGNASGATFDSGASGTAGDGITAMSHATSGNGGGLGCTGAGSGPGIGAKSGTGASAHGIHAAAVGSSLSDGFHCSSTVSGFGVGIVPSAGDGINIAPTGGHGINITANGTSKHGLFVTGGTGGTSDGMKVVAGTGGVDFRGNINSLTIQKNTALSAFPFFLVKSSDHVSGAAGMTVTATRRLDNGSFASCANAVTEVAGGWYTIDLAAADLNGNTVALLFTAPGADPRPLTIVTQL